MASKYKHASSKVDDGQETVFLDVLTKEEKEELLNKKMEEIRKKNEALKRRHALIEADKKAAEERGQAVSLKSPPAEDQDEPSFPHEGVREERPRVGGKPHGRGRQSNGMEHGPRHQQSEHSKHDGKQNVKEHRDMKGVASNEERQSKFARGRGKKLSNMSQQKLKAQEYENSKKNSDPKNIPPPDPSYNFLSDHARDGDDQAQPTTNREAKSSGSSSRHPRNYGGQSFDNVKQQIQTEKKEKSTDCGGPPDPKGDMTISMTGRERREYAQWRSEREKIDQARIDRQKKADGAWKREWDVNKKDQANLPPSPPSSRKMEPGRRPGNHMTLTLSDSSELWIM